MASKFDPLPEIVSIIRDAIKDGLIQRETLQRFDHQVQHMEGTELEAYLQDLWDNI